MTSEMSDYWEDATPANKGFWSIPCNKNDTSNRHFLISSDCSEAAGTTQHGGSVVASPTVQGINELLTWTTGSKTFDGNWNYCFDASKWTE